MIINLLKITPSLKNKKMLYCDFLVTIGEFDVVLKGCQLVRWAKTGKLVLSYPKMVTEGNPSPEESGETIFKDKKIFSPVYFPKLEQNEMFKKKAIELILQAKPELVEKKKKSPNPFDKKGGKYERKFTPREPGSLFFKSSSVRYPKPPKQTRDPIGDNKSVHADPKAVEAGRKVDFSKFSDLPSRIQKPSRTTVTK